MESKELIVTMLCYVGVLLEICIEYVINRCHYFGWYELGFNCCVFAMVLIVVLVVCWIYFLFVKGYTNNYMCSFLRTLRPPRQSLLPARRHP